MHPFVAHIAGGDSFFSGAFLIVVALATRATLRTRWISRPCMILLITGFLLAALSSTPLPLPVWCGLTAATLSLLKQPADQYRWTIVATCAAWTVTATSQIGPVAMPSLSADVADLSLPVVVLADSVTSGLGEGEANTWPQMLADQSQNTVIDLSHVGETVASALKRARNYELPAEAVVILELGGNDLLGGTSPDDFSKSLNELLDLLSGPGRHVFLFELPLPPWHSRWGTIQKSLASRHNVALIPRRQLAEVFSGKQSTLDSIHLSQLGHERMLEIVRKILQLHVR